MLYNESGNNMATNKTKEKAVPSIEELCKKYDNILPISKQKKVPLLGEANCTK